MIFTSLSALALAGLSHAAGQPADGVTGLAADDDTIVVTASRTPRPLSEVGQSVTIIGADEIERRQTQAVADLLRTVPGVTFTRNGGIGTSTSVNIRGADSDQVVALIDGVKLNDPSGTGGGFNFGNLLVGNIERIEVVRGSQSVIWGSQAIGGVVNLLTRQPTARPAANLRAEYGWRDTAQIVGNLSGTLGPVAGSVGAGYFRTDGFSAFNEERGGVERDGYRNFGANAKFDIRLTEAVSVDLRGYYSDGRTDIDGFPPPAFAFGDTREYAETKEMIGYAGLNAALFDGRLRNRLAYAHTRTDRENFDPDQSPAQTFDALGENARFEYQGVLDLDGAFSAVFGAETEKSSFTTASYGDAPAGADARITSVYGEASVTALPGLSLTGGVRHDHHDRFGSATTFAASGVFTPNDGATQIRASYGEGFKAPSLFQLYSLYGNPNLEPERSESWDVGLRQSLLGGAARLGATYFRRDTENQIDFVSCFDNPDPVCIDRPSGTYDNIRLTRASGVELDLTLRPSDALQVSGQYSFINARNRLTGRELARRPRQTVSALVDYRWPFGLSTGATIAHVGASFDNATNTTRLGDYVLVDLRAAFPLNDRIELYGRVENLFDESYETVFRYGTPRRAAYAGVRLSL